MVGWNRLYRQNVYNSAPLNLDLAIQAVTPNVWNQQGCRIHIHCYKPRLKQGIREHTTEGQDRQFYSSKSIIDLLSLFCPLFLVLS